MISVFLRTPRIANCSDITLGKDPFEPVSDRFNIVCVLKVAEILLRKSRCTCCVTIPRCYDDWVDFIIVAAEFGRNLRTEEIGAISFR